MTKTSLFRFLQKAFELLLPPMDFRWQMLAFAGINIIICVVLEDVIVEYLIFKGLRKW